VCVQERVADGVITLRIVYERSAFGDDKEAFGRMTWLDKRNKYMIMLEAGL